MLQGRGAMVISETHQKINTLKGLVPGGFVFVLDTTDRSFLFKSKKSPDCEQRVISLDKIYGIDTLTKGSNYYHHEDDTSLVKISKIGDNTFLGLCAPKKNISEDQWERAEDFLRVSET